MSSCQEQRWLVWSVRKMTPPVHRKRTAGRRDSLVGFVMRALYLGPGMVRVTPHNVHGRAMMHLRRTWLHVLADSRLTVSFPYKIIANSDFMSNLSRRVRRRHL